MKILCLFLVMILAFPMPVVAPVAEDIATVDYINNEFTAFIDEYNQLDCADCNATSIEYQSEIYVVDYQTVGQYFDFDGENGFCIVADDEIVEMQVYGDYPQLREDGEYAYDILSGFLKKEGDTYVTCVVTQTSAENTTAAIAALLSGQAATTVYITNEKQYVTNTYGSSYTLYSSQNIANFTAQHQFQCSVYTQTKNGAQYSEGNCVLTSVYTMLRQLQKSGVYPKLPTGYTSIKTATDPVYAKAIKAGYQPRGAYVQLPTLYAKIREIAVAKYGYTVSSFQIQYTDDLIRDVLKAYGYTVSPQNSTFLPVLNTTTLDSKFETSLKTNLKQGYPVVFNTSVVYGGGHSITISGYNVYRRTYKVGSLTLYQYVKMLAVDDHHASQIRYFDYTAYSLPANYAHMK